MSDEIINELWRVKDAIAEEHEFDYQRLLVTLRKYETSGAPLWPHPSKRLEESSTGNP